MNVYIGFKREAKLRQCVGLCVLCASAHTMNTQSTSIHYCSYLFHLRANSFPHTRIESRSLSLETKTISLEGRIISPLSCGNNGSTQLRAPLGLMCNRSLTLQQGSPMDRSPGGGLAG